MPSRPSAVVATSQRTDLLHGLAMRLTYQVPDQLKWFSRHRGYQGHTLSAFAAPGDPCDWLPRAAPDGRIVLEPDI